VIEFYQIYGLKTNEICQIFLNLKALKVTIRVSGRKKCKIHIEQAVGKIIKRQEPKPIINNLPRGETLREKIACC
jgi:hypothetical protein